MRAKSGRSRPRRKPGITSKILLIHILRSVTAGAHILAIWLAGTVDLFPDRDSMMSILSSFAEITAGLYGITLANYTFFLSRMDGLMASDATMEYIVGRIKKRFQGLVAYITFNVAMLLGITLCLMYCPQPESGALIFFYRLFCNEFILYTASSISLILYYSVMVVDSKCVENEAAKLKKELSKHEEISGDIGQFIELYDRMEAACYGRMPTAVQKSLTEHKGRRFGDSLTILQELDPQINKLLPDILRVQHYYECTINSSSVTVTQEMCLLAEGIVHQLSQE